MSRNRRKEASSTAEMRMLADSIRVTPIGSRNLKCPSTLPVKALGNSRHYAEFKSVYEENIRDSLSSPKSSTRMIKSSCVVDPLACPFKTLRDTPKQNIDDLLTIPRLNPIKTIRCQSPSYTNRNAIIRFESYIFRPKPIEPRRAIPKRKETSDKQVGSTHEFVEKLKELEADKDTENIDLIEQANKEIDVASTQIEKIQDLLKSKLSHTEEKKIHENEDKGAGERPEVKPRWSRKKHKVNAKFACEKNKMLVALNTLNRKLQKMQDKYFKQPHIRYRSVADTSNRSVEFLFKNRNFGEPVPEPEQQYDVASKSGILPPLQYKPNTTDLHSLVLTELKNNPTQLKNNKPKIFKESGYTSQPQSALILEDKTVTTPKKSSVSAKVDVRCLKSEKAQLDAEKEDGSVKSNSASSSKTKECPEKALSKNFETVVKKSDYLTKEFSDAKNSFIKELSVNISNFENKMSAQQDADIREFGLKVEKERNERRINLRNNINAALRNSLYSPAPAQ